ncbi:mitochondrial transcription termination factor family protein [Wolffia australiana]
MASSLSARWNRTCAADPCSSRSLCLPWRRPARTFYRVFPVNSDMGISIRALQSKNVPIIVVGRCQSDGNDASLTEQGEEDEARAALMQLLEECGALREDSLEIVSKCPKYLDMLMGNVRELDENSLWGSWAEDKGVGEECDSGLNFRKKVYLMAKKKGDEGVLPFLESIGLKYSSAVHISGYMSSSDLPELIDKVKFMKELLFSRSDRQPQLGKSARRMMMQLSISVDEDIGKTLSFFEKMEARRGGLTMLQFEDTSLPCLVESFPHLLSCSLQSQWKPLIEILETVGVSKEFVKDILLLFPPLIFYDTEGDLKPRIRALSKFGVEGREVGKMLVRYPWILSRCIQENIEKVYHFLLTEKVLKSSIDRAVRSWPQILGCSTGRFKSMIKQLNDLGVSNKMLGKVISRSPQLLLRKPDEFLKVVSFMEEIGFDQEKMGPILCRCPELFAADADGTLRRKLDFFADFGISSPQLARVLRKYPELLLLDVDRTLLPRARFLMKAGLSRRQVGAMVFRFSPLLGYSVEEVLRPKLEFLVHAMERPVGEVVDYPRYFSYSLEKKIKPRFRLLRARKLDCSLKDMLAKNDDEFAEDFLGLTSMLLLPPQQPLPSLSESDGVDIS